jgi:hypothetical protein
LLLTPAKSFHARWIVAAVGIGPSATSNCTRNTAVSPAAIVVRKNMPNRP